MRPIILLIALIFGLFACRKSDVITVDPDDQTVYEVTDVDVLPYFDSECKSLGGNEAWECNSTKLLQFLYANLKYPEEAKANDIEGRVVIGFVVEKDGSVVEAEILRDIGYGCGEEALRVVMSMPYWQPAVLNGRYVRTEFILPVSFKLP